MFGRRTQRLAARTRVAGHLRAAADLLAPEHGYGYVGVDEYLVHYQLGGAFDTLVDLAGDEEPPRFWDLLADALTDLTAFPALGLPKPRTAEECRRRLSPG